MRSFILVYICHHFKPCAFSCVKCHVQMLCNSRRGGPDTTSFPGSLFSSSPSHWNKDPGRGWSRIWVIRKSVGQEGWQSVLIVVVVNFVGFKTLSSH